MLRIRKSSKSDAPILTAIHADGFANYWDIESFNDLFGTPGTIALIAEWDEKPVGILVYRVVYEQADIITVAVLQEYRRQGVGHQLLRQAMQEVKQLGAKAMFLDVEDGNAAGLALYARYGFNQINRRKLYYRQKDGSYTDALVMTCKLA